MGKIIAAYGGGFKPPTKGHFKVVTDALAKFPEIDEFIIYVGSGTRDGISQLESILIWEIYNNYLPMKVKIEPSKSPIGDIIRLGKNNPQDTVYFVIGSREGNEGDQKDYESRTKNIEEKYPNMEVKLITTSDTGISGTKARKALLDSPEEFYKFTPEELNDREKGEVFDTLRQSITETSNLEDGKSAPFGSGYIEVKEIVNFISLEKTLDDMFEDLGIDINFTTHFKERVIERGLTEDDIVELMEKIYNIHGDEVADLDRNENRVFSHLKRLVDIAAINKGYGDDYLKDLVLKTAYKRKSLREPEFRTNISSPKLKVNENASYSGNIDYKKHIVELTKHMLDNGMNIKPLPKVIFVNGDSANARQFLGKTAYYNPNDSSIVLYTEGRHPKDIVRSFSHEMIHHIQNLEGRLDNITTTNTQEDDNLNDIEAEANLKGTMTFRNWTDSLNENVSASSFPNSALLFGGFFTGIQRMGIGKTIISDLFKSNPKLDNLLLYTQDDAVGFWKKLGGKIIQQGEDKKGILRYFVQINRNDVDPNLNLKQLGISYKNLSTKKSKIDKGEYAIKMGKQKIGFFFVRDIGTIQMDPMSIFADNLNEGKQVGLLYHVTTPENLKKILDSNTLKGSISDFHGGKDFIGISTTRNKNFLYNQNQIQIVLDGDKISNNYKIMPYDYWRRSYDLPNNPQAKDEDEEIIKVGGDGLRDIKKYIVKINNFTDSLNESTVDSKLYPFKIKDKTYDENDNSLITVEYNFTTPSNTYRVEFYSGEYNPEAKTFDLSFGVDRGELNTIDTFQMTGEGNARKVFNTILNIVEDFIDKEDVKKIVVDGTDEKRKRIYKTLFSSTPPKISDKIELNEAIVGEKIECDNCDWSWKIVDGGDDLFMCHKCGHDNTPLSENILPQEKFAKETGQDWVKRALQILPHKEKYNTSDYKVKILSVDKIKPTQFGEDYINASSEYEAEVYDEYLKGERSVEDLRKEDFYPIVVDKDTMEILDGNHRHAVHTMLGIPKIKAILISKKPINEESKPYKHKHGFDDKLGKDPFGLNQYARELVQGLEEEMLNEGRYDKITNQVSREVFTNFKEIYDSGAKEGKFEFSVGPDDEDIFSEDLEFNLEGYIEVSDEMYQPDGGANAGYDDDGEEITPLIQVSFKIPQDPKEFKWSEVSFDIKDIIRHEIEHLTQDGENLKSGKYLEDDQLIRKLINVKMLPKSQYFKLEKEVDAMLQGLYFRAKKSRTPFKEVILNYFKKVGLTKEEQKQILDVWRSRRKALALPTFENTSN